MKKQYYLENEQLEWFKGNYANLGAIKCAEYLKLPQWFMHKMARKYNLNISIQLQHKYSILRAKARSIAMTQQRIIDSTKILIDSPEKAYVLGFLWGDGYLYKSQTRTTHYPFLNIQQTDFDEIISIFECFGKWKASYRQLLNRKLQGQAYLMDSSFGLFLWNNDYHQKSEISSKKILSIIPNQYKQYWWRGYIDADGCFYVGQTCYQFALAGSYKQDWNEFEQLLKILNIKYTIRRVQKEKTAYSHVRITNKQEIKKLGHYLYSNGFDIGLKRKYNKCCQIIAKC